MEISAQEFRDVQTLVRELCGLVLSDDKTYLVRARLEAVMKSHGCATFGDYLGRVQRIHSVAMRDELVESLTTGETSFFRDGHPFDEFRRRVLPVLVETFSRRRQEGSPISPARFWSAGCSTGQEAYSLAIAVQEFVTASSQLGLRPDQFPILATDVSNKSLHVAREGRYPSRDVDRGLSEDLKRRYFRPHGKDWIANEGLRKQIDFRRLNLIDSVPNLGPFEAIFCRNVLMYFDVPTRQRLCDRFYQLLSAGGILIVGAAEGLYGLSTPLRAEQIGATTVYRKTS